MCVISSLFPHDFALWTCVCCTSMCVCTWLFEKSNMLKIWLCAAWSHKNMEVRTGCGGGRKLRNMVYEWWASSCERENVRVTAEKHPCHGWHPGLAEGVNSVKNYPWTPARLRARVQLLNPKNMSYFVAATLPFTAVAYLIIPKQCRGHSNFRNFWHLPLPKTDTLLDKDWDLNSKF